MMQTISNSQLELFIFPPSPSDSEASWQWSLGGTRGHAASIRDLPRSVTATILIIPAELTSWHNIILPKARGARLAQALRGTLEDKLLEEIENLHLAIPGSAKAGMSTWVAAISRSRLANILSELDAGGFSILKAIPEWPPAHVDNSGEVHIKTLRWTVAPVIGISNATGTLCLPGTPGSMQTLAAPGGYTNFIFHDQESHEQFKIVNANTPLGNLQLIEDNGGHQNSWDFLQFEFKNNSRRLEKIFQRAIKATLLEEYKIIRRGLLIACAINFMGLIMLWLGTNMKSTALQREISQNIAKLEPSIGVIRDADRQLTQIITLKSFQQGWPNHNSPDFALAKFSEILPAGSKPVHIAYTGNKLHISFALSEPVDSKFLRSDDLIDNYDIENNGLRLEVSGK